MRIKLLLILTIMVSTTNAQQNYHQNDFAALYVFGEFNGILDTMAINPQKDAINESSYCVKYRRSKNEIYDNLKLQLVSSIKNVNEFTSYQGDSKKIKLKVFSTAPVGTQIELQLGKKNEIAYPDGVHSQYQAYTTKQNQWEIIEFDFAQIPQGSKVSKDEIDQITILFAPKTETNDIFYYDDLAGLELEDF
jgi:hypothetical protein